MTKRYSVHMTARVSRDVELEAETPEEAVRLARDSDRATLDGPSGPTRGQMRPEYVEEHLRDEDGETSVGNSWEILGYCEACQVPLLDAADDETRGRVYAGDEDGDGVYLCPPCAAKCVDEAGADAEPVGES